MLTCASLQGEDGLDGGASDVAAAAARRREPKRYADEMELDEDEDFDPAHTARKRQEVSIAQFGMQRGFVVVVKRKLVFSRRVVLCVYFD